ncbi:uncharacterized protein LOC134276407, partial [Saccostrea cucullata]|uniref:uncharacterized protein LOC134276407 n=1 Tax=Saccostrea cuccullata TaxID=36930 RepID=UPI002ED59352
MAKTDNFPLKHIAELNLKITSNWRIKAKLSFTNEKTKVAPFKSGDGKICRVILEDETSKIVGISFGSLAECVASKVTHNREYYIKGAKIKNVYKTNNVGHGYELHFAEGTEFQDASNGKIICLDKKTVQSCEKKVSKAGNSSGTSRNGGLNLKPTCLREVRQASQNLLDAQKFDILAILKKTKKPEPKQNGMMKRFYRKEITLIDETGEVILSLASSKKKDFDKHSWLKSTIRVIVVKGCVWKKKGTT